MFNAFEEEEIVRMNEIYHCNKTQIFKFWTRLPNVYKQSFIHGIHFTQLKVVLFDDLRCVCFVYKSYSCIPPCIFASLAFYVERNEILPLANFKSLQKAILLRIDGGMRVTVCSGERHAPASAQHKRFKVRDSHKITFKQPFRLLCDHFYDL